MSSTFLLRHHPLAPSVSANRGALTRPFIAPSSSKRRRYCGEEEEERRWWPRAAPLPPPLPMRAAAALGAVARARPILPLPQPHARTSVSTTAASASASSSTTPPLTRITLLAAGERGTRALARLLSAELRAGDCYFLRGRVGAGKSAFSRAFVRAAAGDPYLPVPSPTFLLLNTYEVGGGAEGEDEGASGNSNSNNPHNTIPPPIHHFDLYRLDPAKTSPAELVRLDIPGALASGVALVEWPERLVAIAEGAAASGAAAATTAATTTAPLLSLVPQSRVDVYVDPLADDDPSRAELAEALLLSSGGSGGGRRLRAARLRAPSATEEEEDEEEDEDDEDDDDDDSPYADRRWRRWTLVPTSQEWEARLRERLRRAVAAAQRDGEARGGGSSEGGLFLIE